MFSHLLAAYYLWSSHINIHTYMHTEGGISTCSRTHTVPQLLHREVGQVRKRLLDVLIMDPWLTDNPQRPPHFAVEPLARAISTIIQRAQKICFELKQIILNLLNLEHLLTRISSD